MTSFDERRRSFDRRFKFYKMLGLFTAAITIISMIAAVASVVLVLTNPEMIGEYVGRIVKGFESI